MFSPNFTVSRYAGHTNESATAAKLALTALVALTLLAAPRPAAAQTADAIAAQPGGGRTLPIVNPTGPGVPPDPTAQLPEIAPRLLKHSVGKYKPQFADLEISRDMATGKTFTAQPGQAGMAGMGIRSAIENGADGLLFSDGTAGQQNRSLFPETALPDAPALSPPQAPAQEPGKMHANLVYGADDRVRINPTNYFPASAQCHIVMQYPDGAWYQGSGTLIGYKYVLTAGHVVYSHEHGGWARYLYVYPGQNGASLPYGSAYATYLRSVTGWTSSEDSDYDYGLVTLNRAVGYSTGWFGLGSFSNSTLDNTIGYLSGYPGEKPAGTQWQSNGWILDYDSSMVYYKIDETPGNSGSGVYRFYNGSRYVFAVNTGWSWHFDWFNSGYFNHGPRITSSRFSLILGWIATGY
jgi:glutamyl endopeptidase